MRIACAVAHTVAHAWSASQELYARGVARDVECVECVGLVSSDLAVRPYKSDAQIGGFESEVLRERARG